MDFAEERRIREDRAKVWSKMCDIMEDIRAGNADSESRSKYGKHAAKLDELDWQLKEGSHAERESQRDTSFETRGAFSNGNGDVLVKKFAGDKRTEGRAFELLGPDQSMAEWRKRAVKNSVPGVRDEGTDRDINRYWAERMNLRPSSIETRALGEDTTSGPGAGQAIVPQAWSTSFIDVLRPNLIMSRAGATIMPMTTEQHTMPQLLADPVPVFITENGSNTLDNTSKFGPLLFNATGAYQDMLQISRQVAEDSNQTGGLGALMNEVLSRKFARLIDQVALFGTAGNAGNPGLVNESGIIGQRLSGDTGTGGTLTDTTFLSIAAEACRNANAEPSAAITNPSVYGTMARMNASTYAKYWDMPADWTAPVLYSTTLPTVETDPTLGTVPAETGGTFSSLFVGDWSRVIIGLRVDLDVRVLNERYADQGEIGIWSYMRFSIRASHPETFVRVQGIKTT